MSTESMPQRIARLRHARGLSQEQLAEALGVSRQAISKWETGQANPDIRYLAALSRLLGVTADTLLCGDPPNSPTPPPAPSMPPQSRFYGLLILGISLFALGFAGILAMALASTRQSWSMQIGEQIYVGLSGYLRCNPPLRQIFILCGVIGTSGLILSVADLAYHGLLMRSRRRAVHR